MTDDTIGRATYELRAKIDGLKKDLVDAEGEVAKSGQKAETEFTHASSKWGPAMAQGLKAGAKVVATGSAAMFAIATKGALELQDVQNQYQSETGQSAEAAKHAASVINKAAAENQLSLKAVGDAAIAVHNDLGAVGDQADNLTNLFTKFGRVTRQEPVAAVKAFDDILDGWKLTADDVPALMDKLAASHQKYGGAIADDEAALAKLAPAMTALNMTADDGIGLLNLFKSSGLDAAAAIAAMQHAVSQVKSPEEFQKLVDDITATEDPLARAQKAADLFGQKAGPQMAAALATNHLADFKQTAKETAGTVNDMAGALDQGLGAQARRNLSLLGGAIRGLGADWGPGLTGIATFSSALAALGVGTPLKAAWGRVAESAKAAGMTAGSAFAVAFAAAAAAAVVLVADQIEQDTASQQGAIGAAIADQIAKANLEALKASKASLEQGIKDLRANSLINIALPSFTQQQVDQLQAQLDQVNAALSKAGYDGMKAVGEHAVQGFADGAKAAAGPVGTQVPADIARALDWRHLNSVTRAAGNRNMEAFAQAIAAARHKPLDAFNTLVEMLKHPLSRMKEMSRLQAELTSKALAKGLRSKDPEIRAQARATQQYIVDRLAELKGQAKTYGTNTGKAYADGLAASRAFITEAAKHALGGANVVMKASSPPGPESPLHLVDVWGERTMAAWGDGALRARSGIQRAVAATLAGVPSMLAVAGGPAGMAALATGPAALAAMSGRTAAEAPGPVSHTSIVTVGEIHLHGVGSDVTPGAAKRFGQQVLDEVVRGFRDQSARTSGVPRGRP